MRGIFGRDQVNDLLNKYEEKGGQILVRDGCLCNEYLCWGDGLKYAVITEVYLNERSSGYKIKMFNKKLPKKWERYFFDWVYSDDE